MQHPADGLVEDLRRANQAELVVLVEGDGEPVEGLGPWVRGGRVRIVSEEERVAFDLLAGDVDALDEDPVVGVEDREGFSDYQADIII